MRYRQFVWALLAVTVLLSSLAAPKACAQRTYVLPSYPMGPFQAAPLMQPYTPYSNYYYNAPYYIPYVAPYPAYGILPPPFVTAQSYRAATGNTAYESQPRMRAPQSPTATNEKTPAERQADLRRARYEIEVPVENAIVYIEGVKAKQT